MKSIKKANEETLKGMFGDRIKQNFLISMLNLVMIELGQSEFPRLFNIRFDKVGMVTGNSESPDYEICRNIVSIHRSNCIFMKDEERRKKEQDDAYKKKLAQQVIDHLRLRKYAGAFFKKYQLIQGDEFLFFPIPYKLFALSTYALNKLPANSRYISFYYTIFKRSLGVLTLIENNLLDSCYPVARSIIELYLKLRTLKNNENVLDMHDYLVETEIGYSCCNKKLDDVFMQKFDNRKFRKDPNRLNFLHYGWVDEIKDYDGHFGGTPYSPSGLFSYLKWQEPDHDDLDELERLYKMSHAFVHGNVSFVKYPLLYYFEVSAILYLTVAFTYLTMCHELNISTEIDGFDVMKSLEEDASLLFEQYGKRNEENFERYYRKKG